MLKKIVTTGLVLFWTVYVGIVAAGLAQNSSNKTPGTTTIPVVNTSTLGQITLDTTEVTKHSTPGSCWMIINSKVYDITTYFGSHPGGNSYLAAYCGKDATTAFDVSPHAHSSYATGLLARYLLGNLGQVLNQGATVPTTTTPVPVTNSPTAASGTPATTGSTYTTSDVAAHSSASSCWLIVGGNVYNVSSFIASNTHRAGNSVIISYCGKDATSAFGVHNNTGYSVLSSYFIGTIGSATTGNGSTTTPSTTTAPAQTNTSGEDD